MISLGGAALFLGVVVVTGLLVMLAAWVGFRTCLINQKHDQAALDGAVRRAVAQHKAGFQKWFDQNFQTVEVPKTPFGPGEAPAGFENDILQEHFQAMESVYVDRAPGTYTEDEV